MLGQCDAMYYDDERTWYDPELVRFARALLRLARIKLRARRALTATKPIDKLPAPRFPPPPPKYIPYTSRVHVDQWLEYYRATTGKEFPWNPPGKAQEKEKT